MTKPASRAPFWIRQRRRQGLWHHDAPAFRGEIRSPLVMPEATFPSVERVCVPAVANLRGAPSPALA